jgi:hypothetical protein
LGANNTPWATFGHDCSRINLIFVPKIPQKAQVEPKVSMLAEKSLNNGPLTGLFEL